MYEIRNKSGQEISVNIERKGRIFRIFLISKSKRVTESLTDSIKAFRDDGMLRVREINEDFDVLCQAETSDGDRCKNEANYPEDNPKYCYVHKELLEE